jgi:hypothetical protein
VPPLQLGRVPPTHTNSSWLVALSVTGWPDLRINISGFPVEHEITSSMVPAIPSSPGSTWHEVMFMLVCGFERARAYALHSVETSLGSWSSAPPLSHALPSIT